MRSRRSEGQLAGLPTDLHRLLFLPRVLGIEWMLRVGSRIRGYGNVSTRQNTNYPLKCKRSLRHHQRWATHYALFDSRSAHA